MKMKVEIKHRLDGVVLFEVETDSLKNAVESAVKERAYLRGAYLTGAYLTDADLTDAYLRGAYLRGAEKYYTVPQLHTKILAAIEAGGTLEMRSWHACETTHCRAGWAIHLAGPAGKFLEACMGSAAAGALITLASCPWMEKVPNFYASNEEALADIRACALKEAE